LTRRDLRLLAETFGELRVGAERMVFLRLLDRQLLRGRAPIAAKALALGDDIIHRLSGTSWLSYHQVIVLRKGDSGGRHRHSPRRRKRQRSP
jgi:hypothetical protein